MTNVVNVGYLSANYYALDIQAGRLLIDCGWPGSLPRLSAELKRKSIPLNQIKYLLVTHLHPDHAGLAGELQNQGVRLILMDSQPAFIDAMEALFRKKKMPFQPIQPTESLLVKFPDSRNFLLRLGLQGEILSTPGHSPDSISLILDEGDAFTGDLHPAHMVPEGQKAAAQKSWDAIRGHPITCIHPGHGNAFS